MITLTRTKSPLTFYVSDNQWVEFQKAVAVAADNQFGELFATKIAIENVCGGLLNILHDPVMNKVHNGIMKDLAITHRKYGISDNLFQTMFAGYSVYNVNKHLTSELLDIIDTDDFRKQHEFDTMILSILEFLIDCKSVDSGFSYQN